MSALLRYEAPHHVSAVSGFVRTFREIVNAMHDAREKDDAVEAGDVGHWIEQLDFIGNALSTSNDQLIELMREQGIETVMPTGSVVHRPKPPAD